MAYHHTCRKSDGGAAHLQPRHSCGIWLHHNWRQQCADEVQIDRLPLGVEPSAKGVFVEL